MYRLVKILLSLFDGQEKRELLKLVAMMLIGACLEVVGIGLIVPFIAILGKPETIASFPSLKAFASIAGASSAREILLLLGLALLVIYTAKNLFLGTLYFAQARFSFKKQATLSQKLYSSYLHASYAFHLQNNSAILIRNIVTEVSGLVNGVLLPLLMLVTESIVMLFVLALLFIAEPVISAVTLLLLGPLSWLAYVCIKPLLDRVGKNRSENMATMIKWVNQGLGSLKEIKVANREAYFIEEFKTASSRFSNSSQVFATLGAMPRLFFETLIVAAILSVVITALSLDLQNEHLLPALALFAMASVRVMPAASRILGCVNGIRYYRQTADTVFAGLRCTEQKNSQPDTLPVGASMLRLVRSLEVRDMSFKYPLAPAWTLDSVSLVINRGESVAFTGASGAGKSTLIDILLGLIAPQHGEVTVDGTNILMNLDGWRQTIGYVPQTIYLLDDSVRANIAFGISPENINEARIWRALEMAQLADMVRQLPQGLNTTVGERGARISGGERQRIGIARALYHDPEVLIFDEATSALDHRTEREIAETINALRVNKTLIIVAHRMTSVVHCDRIYFVKNGQIADKGTYNELVANNSDFRKMTGEPDD